MFALLGALVIGGTAQAAAPSFASSFTGSATPDGSMTPGRLAVDERTGVVYVIDLAHDAVDEFSSSGTYLGQLRGSQTTPGAGRFAFSSQDDDIAVDNSGGPTQGNVYVVGEGNPNGSPASGSEVSAFSASGTFLWQVAPVPLNGSNVDTCGVAVDAAGNLWTNDYYSGLEQHSPSDGSVSTTGSAPTGTCHIALDSTGALYIAGWQGPLSKIAPPSPYSSTPTTVDGGSNFDVATDSSNNDVYAVHSDRVLIYDSSGSSVGEFADGTPLGVAVDGVHGLVYVSDPTNSNVHVYAWPAHRLTVNPAGTGSGSVSADAGLLNGCSSSGGTCADTYKDGRSITLTATPATGSRVTWSGGGCSGSGETCQVTLNGSDVAVTATFSQAAPTATTAGPSGVGTTSATIAGTVNPSGATVTDCHFDYGTTAAYGAQAPCSSAPGGGTSDVAVSATLSGLSSGTQYHYRVVATNSGGTGTGADATFTTSPVQSGGGGGGGGTTCPADLSKCPLPTSKVAGFNGTTLLLKLGCTGFAGQTCSGKLTFKSVIKVRVKHGKKTKVVKKTITVATVSYSVAASRTTSIKLKLTSAAKTALKSGGLTARAGRFSIKLPKTKVRKKAKRH